MKNRALNNIFLGILMAIIAGCTDVPLSFNTTVTDERILGYWQDPDGAIFQISKLGDGSSKLTAFRYDEDAKEYRQDGDPEKLYFTSMVDKGEAFQFLSVETGGEVKGYVTSRLTFPEPGKMVLQDINPDLMEQLIKPNKDGLVEFGTPEKFQEYVHANIHNAAFFGEVTRMNKLEKLPKG